MKATKKPVTIDAFQMTKEARQDNSNWPEWLNLAWNKNHDAPGAVYPVNYPESDGTDELVIHSLEGLYHVAFDDWIVRGIKGELYPCKPDIFAATYEITGTGEPPKGPSVTPEMIDEAIGDVLFFRPSDVLHLSGHNVAEMDPEHPFLRQTIAAVALKNGYGVVGVSSCVSGQNFDVELGRTYALREAKDKIGELLAFNLRNEMAS